MVPEGWRSVTGAEITTKITKGSSPRWQGFDYQDDGVLFVTSENVRDGFLDLTKEKYLPTEFGLKMNNSKLMFGDILINIVGASIGRSCRFEPKNTDARINQAVALFRVRPDINSKFVAYFFQSPETIERLLRSQSSTARSNLSLADLRNFVISLPPLHEQQKIADILSTWDRAIEAAQDLLANAEAQKRALMQQLLTGKRHLKGFEGRQWRCLKIADIAREVSERNRENDNLPVVSCSKSLGFVSSLEYFNKQVFSDDRSNYKVIRRGQIGYPSNHVEEGSIGLQDIYDAAVASPIYTVFQVADQVNELFLFRVLKTERYRQMFAAATNASVDRRGSLRWKAFSSLPVTLPPLAEQVAINEVLDASETLVRQTRDDLNRISIEKRALMQQLLTGKRRVTP